MKPLNRAERASAFWRFLLLFAITITVVGAVVFFSLRVSATENKQLRQRMVEAETEKMAAEKFTLTLRDAVNEVSKYESGEGLSSSIYMSVNYRVDELNNLLKEIPNSQNSIYALAVRTLTDLNKARNALSAAKPQ